MAITKPSRGMLDTGISDSSDATAITIDSSENATFANNISLADSKKILVGSGSDLEIYFDGTNSFIKNDSGILNIRNNDIRFKTSGDETSLRAVANGAVELMHNNATKLSTAADGIDVTGHIDTATITTTGNSTIGGNLTVTGNFQVDGTTTTINSTALTVDDLNITLASGAGSSSAANGAGITVDGANATWNYVHTTTSWESNKDITLGDDKKLRLGASQDLNLYHNSSNSRTYMTGNDLELSVNSFRLFNLSGATGMISATASGVSLLQNTSVTGTLSSTSTLGITGAISSGADTTIATFGRVGSAVSSSIIYADATTDMEFGTTTSHALSLITADTRRLTIDNSGNATFSANLIVNGNTTLGNADSDTVTIPGPLAVDTDTLYVDVTNDRVGINVGTSPTKALEVSSGGADVTTIKASYNSTNYLEFAHNRINAVSSGGNDHIAFQTAGTTRAFLDVNGRLGIGTTSPAQGLHLASGKQARFDDHVSIQPTKRLYIDGGGDTFIEETAANEMTFTTAGAERMRVNASGKISIGNNIPMWSGEYGGALFLKGNNSTSDRLAEITTVDSNGATTGTGLVVKGAGSGINVGINTSSPKDKFHIQTAAGDGHAFGGKSLSLTTSYQTGAQLAITLADHQGCYVKVFITGDWSSHSAIAFLGEYFIQNGASGYAEPGVIIREVDNTHSVDSLSSQIVDSTDDTFQIQFKLNHTHNANTATGLLNYQIMGQFDTIA